MPRKCIIHSIGREFIIIYLQFCECNRTLAKVEKENSMEKPVKSKVGKKKETQIKIYNTKPVTLCWITIARYLHLHPYALWKQLYIIHLIIHFWWSIQHSAGAEMCSTKSEEKNTLTQQHTYISVINMLHACCSVNAFDFPLIHMPASFILTLLIHMVLNSFDEDSVSFFVHKNFMVTFTNAKTHTHTLRLFPTNIRAPIHLTQSHASWTKWEHRFNSNDPHKLPTDMPLL